VEPADVTTLSERVARTLALGPDDGMLAREIVTALDMIGSPEYAAQKVRTALRANAAFVEVSRGRWQLGHRLTTTPPPLPHDDQQEWIGRALNHLVKAATVRATQAAGGSSVSAGQTA
jgi:hypothetical protein